MTRVRQMERECGFRDGTLSTHLRDISVEDANEFIAPLINEILLRLREDKKEIERLKFELERNESCDVTGKTLALSAQLTVAREKFKQIADDCEECSRSEGIDEGEKRAWRAIKSIAASALSQIQGIKEA